MVRAVADFYIDRVDDGSELFLHSLDIVANGNTLTFSEKNDEYQSIGLNAIKTATDDKFKVLFTDSKGAVAVVGFDDFVLSGLIFDVGVKYFIGVSISINADVFNDAFIDVLAFADPIANLTTPSPNLSIVQTIFVPNTTITESNAVPEPTSLLLFMTGFLGFLTRGRNRILPKNVAKNF